MKSYEKVQKWLDENDMSQREFADKVGMTEVAMSRFLRGERVPNAPYIANIAESMGLENPWELIKDDYVEIKDKMKEEIKKPDTITLKDALEIPVWKIVWACKPTKVIDVRMTYQDLKVICDLFEKQQARIIGL